MRCSSCADPIFPVDVDNDYDEIQVLARGTFGEAILAKDKKTDEKVVIKKSLNSEPFEITQDLVREVSALQALRGHPDIIEFKGLDLKPESEPQIVLEAASQSLHDQ